MTVLAQHQPIAHAPDLQCREHVGIDEIQQPRRIRPLNVDLAQGRDIGHPHRVAHVTHLAVAALLPVGLARLREIAGPVPQTGLDHRCAA